MVWYNSKALGLGSESQAVHYKVYQNLLMIRAMTRCADTQYRHNNCAELPINIQYLATYMRSYPCLYFNLQVILPESKWISEALLVLLVLITRIVRIESSLHHNSHLPKYVELNSYM